MPLTRNRSAPSCRGRLEPEPHLVYPEALQALLDDVQAVHIRAADIAHRFQRAEMAIEQFLEHVAHRFMLRLAVLERELLPKCRDDVKFVPF